MKIMSISIIFHNGCNILKNFDIREDKSIEQHIESTNLLRNRAFDLKNFLSKEEKFA